MSGAALTAVASVAGEYRPTLRSSSVCVLFGSALALAAAGLCSAQDQLALGTVHAVCAPGLTVAVPIHVADVSGSALNADGPVGLTIQSLSVTVEPAPVAAVSAIEFVRDGVAAALTARFETEVSDSARRSWVVAFDESADPLLLTVDPTPPGDLVGMLQLTISGSVAIGDVIDLTLIAATSALGNHPGTVAESVASEQLVLLSGQVVIEGIFCDGFESGDVSRWSVSSP